MGSVKEKQAHASLTYLHRNCQNSYFKSGSICCAAGLQSAGCGRRGGSQSSGCTLSVLAWTTASSYCHFAPSFGSCGNHWRRPALPFLALCRQGNVHPIPAKMERSCYQCTGERRFHDWSYARSLSVWKFSVAYLHTS